VSPDPGLRGVLAVTGTDTGVGKTVVTAAVAAAAVRAGRRVAVLKPAQSGLGDPPTGESDVETVVRLAAPATARTLASYPDALAPLAAARAVGRLGIEMTTVTAAVRELAATHDLVLVEGAGGLLVRLGEGDDGPWTLADLAAAVGALAVVVVRAGLGTLNHTALTLEALDRRGIAAEVVVGSWPTEPGLVHASNLADLAEMADGLAGVVPEGAGGFSPAGFRALAPNWLSAALYGTLP
jgi:dethiobiotin synthetase